MNTAELVRTGCEHCGGVLVRKGSTGPLPRFCSATCKAARWRALNPERAQEIQTAAIARRPRPPVTERPCVECGEQFVGRPNKLVCSTPCRNRRLKEQRKKDPDAWRARRRGQQARRYQRSDAARAQSRMTRARRRAVKKGAELGKLFSWRDVVARDKSICQLCRRPVDLATAAPHPESPSLDHVTPLALGGRHELSNVQLAHLRCNIAKGIRPVGEQLRLI